MRIGIYVVYGASVDSDRGKQARVLSGARQISADAPVVEKNRRSRISAFDASVEVVPLIDPAQWCIRILLVIQRIKGFTHGDLAQESEDAVENTAFVWSGDDQTLDLPEFCLFE